MFIFDIPIVHCRLGYLFVNFYFYFCSDDVFSMLAELHRLYIFRVLFLHKKIYILRAHCELLTPQKMLAANKNSLAINSVINSMHNRTIHNCWDAECSIFFISIICTPGCMPLKSSHHSPLVLPKRHTTDTCTQWIRSRILQNEKYV